MGTSWRMKAGPEAAPAMGEAGLPGNFSKGRAVGSGRGQEAGIDAGAADVLPRTGVVLAGLRVPGRRADAGAAEALQDTVRLRGPDRHDGGHQEGRADEQKLESGHEISFPRQGARGHP